MKRIWWKNKWLWGGTAFLVLLAVFVIGVETNLWPSWTGFGADVEKSITVEKRPDGTITKLTEVSRQQQEKTLWDLLSLLGVPLVLTGLGFWYQNLQQKRIDEQTKEEILQAYFDRVSALLVDKNLIATTKQPKRQHDQVKAATHVIQRQFGITTERLAPILGPSPNLGYLVHTSGQLHCSASQSPLNPPKLGDFRSRSVCVAQTRSFAQSPPSW